MVLILGPESETWSFYGQSRSPNFAKPESELESDKKYGLRIPGAAQLEDQPHSIAHPTEIYTMPRDKVENTM